MSTQKINRMLGGLLALALVGIGFHARAEESGWKAGMALPDLTGFGLTGTLPDLKGKVVVLDFWASWCGPCKASFPTLEALHKAYSARGVVVLGVNLDKTTEPMQAFLKEHSASFPIVQDRGHKLITVAAVKAMPTTVIVGKNGLIHAIHSGFTIGEGPAKLTESIEACLAQGE